MEVIVGSVVIEANDSAAAVVVGERSYSVALAKDLVAVKGIDFVGMRKLYHIQC